MDERQLEHVWKFKYFMNLVKVNRNVMSGKKFMGEINSRG